MQRSHRYITPHLATHLHNCTLLVSEPFISTYPPFPSLSYHGFSKHSPFSSLKNICLPSTSQNTFLSSHIPRKNLQLHHLFSVSSFNHAQVFWFLFLPSNLTNLCKKNLMPRVARKSAWGVKTHIRSLLSLSQAFGAHKLSGLITCLLEDTVQYSTVKLQSAVACKSTAAGPQSFCDLYSSLVLRNVKIHLQKMLWFFVILWRLFEQMMDSSYFLTDFLIPLFLSSRPSELSAVAAACL